MISAYLALFTTQGTSGFTVAGMLARLALPMSGIGIITLLAQSYDSYAMAGSVSATFVLSYALFSPYVSRLVDRYGQAQVLRLASGVSVVGLLLIVWGSYAYAPLWVFYAGATLAGFMPSMSAMTRSRWAALYSGQSRLQTAYSLETVLDELSFIIGPPLAVGLSVLYWPQSGLWLAMVLLLTGSTALAVQRATEPRVQTSLSVQQNKVLGVLKSRGMQALLGLMVSMGVIVGTVDVVSIASADLSGQAMGASVMLSAYALGSCLAGLIFGARQLLWPLSTYLLWGGLAIAVSTIPLMWFNNLYVLVCVLFVAGACFAPTMIAAMSLIEKIVPRPQLTEAMTYLLAGLNSGVAAGAALSGQVVDKFGAQAGFYVAGLGALLVSGVTLVAHSAVRKAIVA